MRNYYMPVYMPTKWVWLIRTERYVYASYLQDDFGNAVLYNDGLDHQYLLSIN